MGILLENVTKSFGADLVVDDVCDEVPTGSLTALLGPSGSGKSTLLRIVAGLTAHDSGRVTIDGRDVTHVAARDRRIGFCFQDYAPFRHLKVVDNISYGLKVHHVKRAERKARVEELLGLVRLEEFADRYPHQLSGGQRQRMALARALAVRPDVLLLDEPFAALDAQVRSELRTWVRSLQRELGITTVLVTHDQSEAMEIADRLVILNRGRIEQVGRPDEVYDAPATEFVRGFLGPVTTLAGVEFRPHEIELGPAGASEVTATIVDVVRLGFEVRVITQTSDGATTWVQLTHDEATARNPTVGQIVSISARLRTAAGVDESGR